MKSVISNYVAQTTPQDPDQHAGNPKDQNMP